MPKVSRRFAAAEAVAPVGYTPPANPEAEQSVLGAILVRPEVMDRIADVIVPEDFYREAHGRIYQAMLDLYGRGEPVDLVTVSALLKERGKLEGVGGPVFLAGLSEQVGFATNAEYYANLVRDKSVLRRLLDCTQEIAASCLAPVENVADFLDQAEHKIFQVAESKVRPGFSAPERPGGHRDRHPGGHLGPERRLPHRGDQRLHRSGQLHRRVPEQRPDHPGGQTQHGQDRPGPEHRL